MLLLIHRLETLSESRPLWISQGVTELTGSSHMHAHEVYKVEFIVVAAKKTFESKPKEIGKTVVNFMIKIT